MQSASRACHHRWPIKATFYGFCFSKLMRFSLMWAVAPSQGRRGSSRNMFYRFFFLVFAWFACATVFVWPAKTRIPGGNYATQWWSLKLIAPWTWNCRAVNCSAEWFSGDVIRCQLCNLGGGNYMDGCWIIDGCRLYNARKQFMQQTHPFVATSRMMQNKGNSSQSDFLPRTSKLSRWCRCLEFLRQISINCPIESITADYWISLTVIWINSEK